jgi:GTP-binding protein
MSEKAQVVIVGRMNVGKSTLFNRLSSRIKSITLDFEGVTRDYLKEEVVWRDARFDLFDSGGIHVRKTQDPLFEQVRIQVLRLVEEADIILFMVDGTVGPIPEDHELARYIHKLNKPSIVLINKVDNKRAEEHEFEFDRLGFTHRIYLSAEHGKGIPELLDLIVSLIPKNVSHKPQKRALFRVMLLGKPNVGKSSLMNSLLEEERAIVSDVPGTTREAFSEQITFYKEIIGLTDTPGIRRQSSVTGNLEPLMVKSAFRALRSSHIVLLLIDGSSDTLVDQELKLAFYVFQEQHKSLILLINKDDLVTEQSKVNLERSMLYYKHLIEKIPVLHISCKTGKNIGRILPLVQKVWERMSHTFEPAPLQRLCVEGLMKKPLYAKQKPLILYRVRQVRTAPPTIELLVNESRWFGPSQLSFFENLIRSEYDMKGVPIKFVVKKRKEERDA